MAVQFKRYCKILELVDDPILIENYKKAHALGAAWPEITRGIKEVGILDMEIYIILFMIMDTVPDFDYEKAMSKLAALPRQAEWEARMSQFQRTSDEAAANEKWRLLERVYELE
jgi:L-rhamnose mutarotase